MQLFFFLKERKVGNTIPQTGAVPFQKAPHSWPMFEDSVRKKVVCMALKGIRAQCSRCSCHPAMYEKPAAGRPHVDGHRLLPPPARGRSGGSGTGGRKKRFGLRLCWKPPDTWPWSCNREKSTLAIHQRSCSQGSFLLPVLPPGASLCFPHPTRCVKQQAENNNNNNNAKPVEYLAVIQLIKSIQFLLRKEGAPLTVTSVVLNQCLL